MEPQNNRCTKTIEDGLKIIEEVKNGKKMQHVTNEFNVNLNVNEPVMMIPNDETEFYFDFVPNNSDSKMGSYGVICRACLQPTTRHNRKQLFNANDTGFVSIFTELTLLHASDDDPLPKFICSRCSQTLKQFKAFKYNCIRSDLHLRKRLIDEEEIADPLNIKVEIESSDDGEDKIEGNSLVYDSENPDSLKKKRRLPTKVNIIHRSYQETTDSDAVEVSPENQRENLKLDCQNNFKCNRCSSVFKSKSNLYTHMMEVHSKTEYNCRICESRFSSCNRLQRHCKEVHTVHTKPENIYTCDQCCIKCKTKSILRRHLKVVHLGERKFECTLCCKKFTSTTHLKRHNYLHSGERPVHCEICKKGFYHKKALDIHMNVHKSKDYTKPHTVNTVITINPGGNVHACDQCYVKCKTKSILKKHIKIVHLGERKFECYLCCKKFSSATHLKRHSYLHSGERPVHCEICKKGFYHKNALDIHMNVHKSKDYTKPRIVNAVNPGENVHACDQCSVKCKTKSILKKHIKIVHLGERKFECTLCCKKFSSATHLKRHSYLHSGKRPLNCEICKKGFYHKKALDIHMNVHESMDYT